MRALLILPLVALFLATAPVQAQDRPPQEAPAAIIFDSYDAFISFIDERMMKRQFGGLMQKMTGGNLTLAQVQQLTEQARKGFTVDFENVAVMQSEDLENGFRKEIRAYWTGDRYAYVFVLMHDRGEDLAILNVGIHVAPAPSLALF
ncbi:hypothetical protein [Tropicimonas sp. IMCC6043]|uniref:hypothetical protein n=1 Tax=Tropicimonas sp. IMCC6043 TaxID=2510645 RepID=UPI00101C1E8F|nr:hypothetical protein [Tropicimonas sp. IMCC6043]RYH12050.1 hypothetical protein EU800_00315 [Tropicimonas sp. IMCC6043]